MKINIRKNFTLLELIFVLAVIALLTALAIPQAHAQENPTRLRALTNVPTSIAASSVSNFTSIIAIPQDRNLAVQANFAASGAGTDNFQWWAKPSVDGTNFMTHNPIIFTVAANGTTQVVGDTNITKTVLEGYRALNFFAVSNASGTRTLYLTNILVGNRN